MRTEADVMDSMKEHFGGVSDPRVPGRTLYPLMEVLVMAFVGVLCGGDDWEGIAAIAEEHESWLRRFLTLQHGVPPRYVWPRVESGRSGGRHAENGRLDQDVSRVLRRRDHRHRRQGAKAIW